MKAKKGKERGLGFAEGLLPGKMSGWPVPLQPRIGENSIRFASALLLGAGSQCIDLGFLLLTAKPKGDIATDMYKFYGWNNIVIQTP